MTKSCPSTSLTLITRLCSGVKYEGFSANQATGHGKAICAFGTSKTSMCPVALPSALVGDEKTETSIRIRTSGVNDQAQPTAKSPAFYCRLERIVGRDGATYLRHERTPRLRYGDWTRSHDETSREERAKTLRAIGRWMRSSGTGPY